MDDNVTSRAPEPFLYSDLFKRKDSVSDAKEHEADKVAKAPASLGRTNSTQRAASNPIVTSSKRNESRFRTESRRVVSAASVSQEAAARLSRQSTAESFVTAPSASNEATAPLSRQSTAESFVTAASVIDETTTGLSHQAIAASFLASTSREPQELSSQNNTDVFSPSANKSQERDELKSGSVSSSVPGPAPHQQSDRQASLSRGSRGQSSRKTRGFRRPGLGPLLNPPCQTRVASAATESSDDMAAGFQRMSGDARRYPSSNFNRTENRPPMNNVLCRNGPQCRKFQEGLETTLATNASSAGLQLTGTCSYNHDFSGVSANGLAVLVAYPPWTTSIVS